MRSCLGALLLLAAVAGNPTTAAASTLGPAEPTTEPTTESTTESTTPPKSSSWWLETGEKRQEQGQHASAGEAYRQALEALPKHKQRANVGARTAMMAADAYWMAFEQDGDVTHLREGFEALDRWLELTGPASQASLRATADDDASRLNSIYDPLKQAEAALAEGDLERASTHSQTALDALAVQRRPWPVGARVVLRIAGAHVDAYDRAATDVAAIEAQLPLLDTARGFLEGWQGRRPEDDESEQGAAIEALLAEIEARRQDAKQRLSEAELAEQQPVAGETPSPGPVPPGKDVDPSAQRRLGIILLATGATAAAAGAGLLGEGVAFRRSSGRELDAERARADELMQMYGSAYPRDEFDASAQQYDQQVRRRNTALVISGSVLAAGGLAAGIAGAVLLAKGRKHRGERVTVRPSVSPSRVHLTLSARF